MPSSPFRLGLSCPAVQKSARKAANMPPARPTSHRFGVAHAELSRRPTRSSRSASSTDGQRETGVWGTDHFLAVYIEQEPTPPCTTSLKGSRHSAVRSRAGGPKPWARPRPPVVFKRGQPSTAGGVRGVIKTRSAAAAPRPSWPILPVAPVTASGPDPETPAGFGKTNTSATWEPDTGVSTAKLANLGAPHRRQKH